MDVIEGRKIRFRVNVRPTEKASLRRTTDPFTTCRPYGRQPGKRVVGTGAPVLHDGTSSQHRVGGMANRRFPDLPSSHRFETMMAVMPSKTRRSRGRSD